MRHPAFIAWIAALALPPGTVMAEASALPPTGSQVVISGVVPDEPARAALLARLRAVYGDARVVDALEVGGVISPPDWTARVARLIDPELQQIRHGQLQVSGTRVTYRGTVANEMRRQQIASSAARALTANYVVANALAVDDDAQAALDQTLANRVVEFDSGAATLTAQGRSILDEMAASIERLGLPRVQIVGHTDSHGSRLANIGLSLERAHAVRDYLVARGIAAQRMSALGAGPDRPVADNDTAEGRARNRRIEFRIGG